MSAVITVEEPVVSQQAEAEVASPRIKALDGLRAVAFLTTFLFHLGIVWGYTRGPVLVYNEVNRWFFLGVDLFFVISGYIITRLLLTEKSKHGNISVKKFFQRRMLRIWPLFYLTIIVSIAGTLILAKRNFDFSYYAKILKEVYLPISCFWFLMPQAVTEAVAKMTEHTRFPIIHSVSPLWSVCVEEQFYLVFPWCVAFTKNTRQLLLCVLSMVLVSELSRATGFPDIPGFFYTNPISRVTPLAVGVLVAICDFSNVSLFQLLKRHTVGLFFLSTLLLIAILGGPAHGCGTKLPSMFPCYPLVVLALGGLLIACLNNQVAKKILSISPLQTIGRYSYSMYLAHFPLVYVLRPTPTQWTFTHDVIVQYLLWGSTSFALTFVIGKIMWHFVEMPLAKLRRRYEH